MDRTRATAAATGRELGVSDVAVLKAAKAGRITRNSDGTFDIDKAKLEWAVNTSPTRGGARNGLHTPDRPATTASVPSVRAAAENAAVSGSLLKARTMRESYEAQQHMLHVGRADEPMNRERLSVRQVAHARHVEIIWRDGYLADNTDAVPA